MREAFLPFSPPSIGEEEIAEVVDALRSGWITTGPKTQRFEKEFAAFVGAPAALAVSSGTGAMLVGLAALGIGPGDEVITTTMTFCSTVHVIEHVGARPVLVDVQPDTLNIDPDQVAAAVTPRTRAIVPVHLYGHPCDMDALTHIAGRHGLQIVEDAAHALPAKFRGRTVGSPLPSRFVKPSVDPHRELPAAGELRTPVAADETTPSLTPAAGYVSSLTAFSFYATKNLTTAEGGMLTGETEAIEQARLWSLHGMSRDAYKRYTAEGSWFYEVVLPGYKCNMTDIQAALGLCQLRKLPAFQQRRRDIVRRYQQAFSQLGELDTPAERPEVESAWHLYAIRLNLDRLRIDRARFIEEMRARNIGTSVHFIPVHIHPYYRGRYGYQPEDLPIAYREYQRLISLPLNPTMTDEDVEDVIAAVKDVVATWRC